MNLKDQLDYLDSKTIESPIKSLEDATENARFPTGYEPALTHPTHRSIVKLRDNGCIDIFAGVHQGFRVDPNKQVINVCTNNLFQHLGKLRSWVTRDAKVEVGGGIRVVNHATIVVDSKGDITVNTDGNVVVNARGNVTVNAGGSVYANARGDIRLKAGGEIELKAGRHIQFTAPRYDFA